MIRLGKSVVEEWHRLWIITGRHPKAESILNTVRAELESWEKFKSGKDNNLQI